jgi:hypothetical protein
MEIVDIYSLWPIKEDKRERYSYLIRNGIYTETIIAGQVMEAQLEIGDDHLLLLSDCYNLDECLIIYLLDKNDRVVDKALLYYFDVSGKLNNLVMQSPSRVSFEFFERVIWRVEVYDKPRWVLPVPYIGRLAPMYSCPMAIMDRIKIRRRLGIKLLKR